MRRCLVLIVISAILMLIWTGCGGGGETVFEPTPSKQKESERISPERADPQTVVEDYQRSIMGSYLGEDYDIAEVEEVTPGEEMVFTIHSYGTHGKAAGTVYVSKIVLNWSFVADAWGWYVTDRYNDGMFFVK